MRPVFVDTSYLIALLNRKDVNHSTASVLMRRIRAPLLTTEYVLTELLDGAGGVSMRTPALAAVRSLRENDDVQVIPASTSLFEDGLALFGARSDKGWGLTDCISFVVMQQEGITDALTADRHFEQAGFRALLRSALQ